MYASKAKRNKLLGELGGTQPAEIRVDSISLHTLGGATPPCGQAWAQRAGRNGVRELAVMVDRTLSPDFSDPGQYRWVRR